MTWTPCRTAEHTWTPIPNWMARYKCSDCYALGYKGIAVSGKFRNPTQMYEYKCPKCHGPTTAYKKRKTGPCPNCR